MKDGLVDTLGASLVQSERGQRGQFNQGPMVSHLELTVERVLQGSRRCRRCAAVHGQYVCIPSASVRNEWRHSDTGVELIVHLLSHQPGGGPRLQAMILVKKGSQLHARAFYSCELQTTELQDESWALKLISEKSECNFVFPGELEIVLSGKLPTPRQGVSLGSNR